MCSSTTSSNPSNPREPRKEKDILLLQVQPRAVELRTPREPSRRGSTPEDGGTDGFELGNVVGEDEGQSEGAADGLEVLVIVGDVVGLLVCA